MKVQNLCSRISVIKSVSKAKILWTLNVITKNQSFRSSGSDSLFKTMFPDSKIAKQFSCGKTKIMNLCLFGLPHKEKIHEQNDFFYHKIRN